MQNRCCAIGYFLNNSTQDTRPLAISLVDSPQLYITTGLYCLHGKLTAVWNFASVKLTEVKFAPKFHSARSHVNANNEILPRSEILNLFEFTSGLM